ncbi:hypothetical protein [Sphingobium chungbukense]|uniref:hypothetical protein n=1 Tax=Sphingobium chungbukense TaxID=56193 RepID=UPI000A5C4D62|nr:hypothetical protein [Sphingobium chungbukense]
MDDIANAKHVIMIASDAIHPTSLPAGHEEARAGRTDNGAPPSAEGAPYKKMPGISRQRKCPAFPYRIFEKMP